MQVVHDVRIAAGQALGQEVSLFLVVALHRHPVTGTQQGLERAADAPPWPRTCTRRAGDQQAHLRLVIKPGGDANLLSGILAAYAGRPGARQVDILFGGATDRADHVRDGRADVALLYAPFDDLTGLDHETLIVEGRVAILPPDHRLASRTEVALADLAQETLPRWKGVRWTGAPAAGQGPEVTDAAEVLQMIRLGRTIAILPRSLVQPMHPDLVYRPVADAPSSALVLAWSQDDRRRLVASFVAAAVEAAGAT
ncbi:LysR family transcriptional regulator substrate-binding protein [Nonomuraea rubra]|uniref:LysR family transcriptional regulator substrate-binding protein n=1 Tax=Nonomuraea rubra TaxID=46180 RepID=UPI00340090E6